MLALKLEYEELLSLAILEYKLLVLWLNEDRVISHFFVV